MKSFCVYCGNGNILWEVSQALIKNGFPGWLPGINEADVKEDNCQYLIFRNKGYLEYDDRSTIAPLISLNDALSLKFTHTFKVGYKDVEVTSYGLRIKGLGFVNKSVIEPLLNWYDGKQEQQEQEFWVDCGDPDILDVVQRKLIENGHKGWMTLWEKQDGYIILTSRSDNNFYLNQARTLKKLSPVNQLSIPKVLSLKFNPTKEVRIFDYVLKGEGDKLKIDGPGGYCGFVHKENLKDLVKEIKEQWRL